MKMHEIKLLHCVAVGALSFLALGCDDGSAGSDPGSSLRGSSGVPTKKYQQTAPVKLTMDITEDPTGCGPSGDPLLMGDALQARIEEQLSNGERLVSASHQESAEAQVACEGVCKDFDAEWTGEVSAQGSYEVGEPELGETEDGSLLWNVTLQVEYDLHCVCEA